VTVNGEARTIPNGTTVTGLLEGLEIRLDLVAVERNGQIVTKARHATTLIEEGDRLEVVTFVGGG